MSYRLPHPKAIYLTAAVSVALTIAGHVLSPPGIGPRIAMLNSGVGTVVFGVVSFLLIRHKRKEDMLHRAAEEIRDLYDNAPCGYLSLNDQGSSLA